MMAWIFSGMFQRFPDTKIALSEGSIGWIPWVLERAHQVLTPSATGSQRAPRQPGPCRTRHRTSTPEIDIYRDYREHFYGCFIDDASGLRMLDMVGEDNVMIEVDYPHSDTTWPHSIKLAHERLDAANLSAEVKYKILRGNAERLYRFTPSTPPEVTRP